MMVSENEEKGLKSRIYFKIDFFTPALNISISRIMKSCVKTTLNRVRSKVLPSWARLKDSRKNKVR